MIVFCLSSQPESQPVNLNANSLNNWEYLLDRRLIEVRISSQWSTGFLVWP